MNNWDQLLDLPKPSKSKRIAYNGYLPAGEAKDLTMEGAGCVRHWWFTYMAGDTKQPDGLRAVHQIRLQIFFDGSETPAVDQPLDTFFGTFLDLEPLEVSSLPITVLKRNGFNAWFPMPYQKGLRIRITNQNNYGVIAWLIADLHQYAEPAQLTPLRFSSHYRKLDPAGDYGFVEMANLNGRGFIAGMFHGTDSRSRTDAWFHTGGDTWLIDGERDPGVIRGTGGEDLVGYSFGIYRSQFPWQGAPYVNSADGSDDGFVPTIFYRFFGEDPIVFQNSIIAKFGTKAARIETNVFAYSDGAVTAPSRGIAQWHLCAPFNGTTPELFDRAEFPETEVPSARTFLTDMPSWQPNSRSPDPIPPYQGRWVEVQAGRGWVDFLNEFRGINYANASASGADGAGYALGWLESEEAANVSFNFAFDDWLKLWVNDVLIGTYRHDSGFSNVVIPVSLRKGKNKVLVKLSNFGNQDFLCWAFHLSVSPSVRA